VRERIGGGPPKAAKKIPQDSVGLAFISGSHGRISFNQRPPRTRPTIPIIAICSKKTREGEDRRGPFVFALPQVRWHRRRRTPGRGIPPWTSPLEIPARVQ
jgi:hypothetical protein